MKQFSITILLLAAIGCSHPPVEKPSPKGVRTDATGKAIPAPIAPKPIPGAINLGEVGGDNVGPVSPIVVERKYVTLAAAATTLNVCHPERFNGEIYSDGNDCIVELSKPEPIDVPAITIMREEEGLASLEFETGMMPVNPFSSHAPK